MGPRPFSRGKAEGSTWDGRVRTGFNGAATFQPRKGLGTPTTPTHARTCFNGAATFQPRKARYFGPPGLVSAKDASMGPQPFGRGKRVARGRVITRGTGFNGAATFQPRKSSLTSSTSRYPQYLLQWGRNLSGRGKSSSCSGGTTWTPPLRWGRNLSAAESERDQDRSGKIRRFGATFLM